jgi:hypothetical protein
MLSAKHLLWFSAGLGMGLGISVLIAPRQGVATRTLLRRHASASLHNAARAERAAEQYASHSATEEGMAEGPIQMRQ